MKRNFQQQLSNLTILHHFVLRTLQAHLNVGRVEVEGNGDIYHFKVENNFHYGKHKAQWKLQFKIDTDKMKCVDFAYDQPIVDIAGEIPAVDFGVVPATRSSNAFFRQMSKAEKQRLVYAREVLAAETAIINHGHNIADAVYDIVTELKGVELK